MRTIIITCLHAGVLIWGLCRSQHTLTLQTVADRRNTRMIECLHKLRPTMLKQTQFKHPQGLTCIFNTNKTQNLELRYLHHQATSISTVLLLGLKFLLHWILLCACSPSGFSHWSRADWHSLWVINLPLTSTLYTPLREQLNIPLSQLLLVELSWTATL